MTTTLFDAAGTAHASDYAGECELCGQAVNSHKWVGLFSCANVARYDTRHARADYRRNVALAANL